MHPINEWEGLSNKLFWIVASERSAIQNNLLLKPSHSFIGCIRYWVFILIIISSILYFSYL